ncbi:MAG: YdcF family protein [Anaerolineaceae bacterium]|nr:YdcF family protein [Anaerolineaceae bacterium]
MIERRNVYSLEGSPRAQVALVLGAGLSQNNTPSDPLRDRVDTAIMLYNTGKVSKLLMSGDNRFDYYNEPEAMKLYALAKGIPEDDIVLDYAGRRTYDSCYRAKAIFGIDEVIVVTQDYHLSRALFICNQLNLKASGVPSDMTDYLRNRYLYWRIREVAASLTAYWDIYISKPLPVLGEFEPIFPANSSQ